MYSPSGSTAPASSRPSHSIASGPFGYERPRSIDLTMRPPPSTIATSSRSGSRSRNEIVALAVSQPQTGEKTPSTLVPRIGLG